MRIAWVVAHHPLKQRVRQGSQAHRRAGMTVADLLHGVGGQYPDGVDSARVDIGPVPGVMRRCQGGDVVEFGHGRAPYIVVWNRCPVAAGEVSTVGRARRMPAVTSSARRTTAPNLRRGSARTSSATGSNELLPGIHHIGSAETSESALAPMLRRPAQASAPKPSSLEPRAVAYLHGRWAKRGLTL
jgi:hypothetical protein